MRLRRGPWRRRDSRGHAGLEWLEDHRGGKFGFRLKDLAEIHLRLRERDRAIEQLERLFDVPSFISPVYGRIDSTLRVLHDDPRFDALSRQRGG